MDNSSLIIDEYKKRHDHMQMMLTQKRSNEDRLIKDNAHLKKRISILVSRIANHKRTIERLRSSDSEELRKENAKLKSCVTRQGKTVAGLGEYEEFRLRQNYSNVKSEMKKLRKQMGDLPQTLKELDKQQRINEDLLKFLQDLSSKKVAGLLKQIIDMKLNEVKLWK